MNPLSQLRTGIGYDTHIFAKGRKLILGGTVIPYTMGLTGHSDADVLSHAIMDAVLGAADERDIGNFFPDDDEKYKDADSIELLKKVVKTIQTNWEIYNVDSVILCQRPKLKAYIPEMKKKLEKVISAPVNVKATTTEKMNAEGEEKCISAQAICLIGKKE